jgi:Serine carboxypeptidase S28.
MQRVYFDTDTFDIPLTRYIADSTIFLTNRTISGKIAEQQHGATVVLEHRFFGVSNPYLDLSVKSFQVHTIRQAIDDLVYFAENVKLAMPGGDQVSPDKVPWVLVGGSYFGLASQLTEFQIYPSNSV